MTHPAASFTPPHAERLADAGAVAARAAALLAGAAADAIARQGRFVVGLTGGRSPLPLYRRLAGDDRDRLPWARTVVLFGDERCVPPDHPDSNFGMAHRELLAHVPVPDDAVLRMPGELPPAEGAMRYEAALRAALAEGDGTIDALLFGVGPDGHAASLFPESPLLLERQRWVLDAVAPEWAAVRHRLTLTLPAIGHARLVLVLCTGDDKRDIARRVLAGEPAALRLPVAHLRGAERTVWLLDGA